MNRDIPNCLCSHNPFSGESTKNHRCPVHGGPPGIDVSKLDINSEPPPVVFTFGNKFQLSLFGYDSVLLEKLTPGSDTQGMEIPGEEFIKLLSDYFEENF